MLKAFDAEPLSNALLAYLRNSSLKTAINKNVPHLSLLLIALDLSRAQTRNSLHLELMTIKALLLLRDRGHLEFVSFTKTKHTPGFVSTDANGFARRIIVRDSASSRVAPLIVPARWIKHGDPIW